MKTSKRKKLEAAGWTVGDAKDFLALGPNEAEFVEIKLALARRLRALREQRNWTQAELAEALDVSRQTINAIETGKFDPSLPLAFRAARLFGLAIEAIFHDPALDNDGSSLAKEIKKDTHA